MVVAARTANTAKKAATSTADMTPAMATSGAGRREP